MKFPLLKKLAPAALALGLASGGALVGSAPAWAAAHSHVAAHAAATKSKATKTAVPKAGGACTKVELGKTAVAGKATLECKKVGKAYKWEVKPAAKKVVKPAAKKVTKK